MKVVLFGASGMVGQAALRESLLDPQVEAVLCVGRSPLPLREGFGLAAGQRHPKLREITHKDFTDFSTIESGLSGYDACFFCLGVSSAGMREEDYRHITYDFTLAAAQALARLNPLMTFIYVSGAGTDSTEKGRVMWARVKGRTENDLLKLPFKAVYLFRPGAIQPLDGITTRTPLYRFLLVIFGPLFPLARILFPSSVTTTRLLGKAMLRAAREGAPRPWVESRDINELGNRS